ncbi:hypothetical protein SNEBB_006586 [Seison nebaliae]|nr:hypothetical protein SNEBB_006586 [Seison nebaliae]
MVVMTTLESSDVLNDTIGIAQKRIDISILKEVEEECLNINGQKIKSINIDECFFVSIDSFNYLLQMVQLLGIEALSLTNGSITRRKEVEELSFFISKQLNNLNSLNLHGNFMISDEECDLITKAICTTELTRLSHLNLSNLRITDLSIYLIYLATVESDDEKKQNLSSLNLSHNLGITKDGWRSFFQRMIFSTNIQICRVAFNPSIDDDLFINCICSWLLVFRESSLLLDVEQTSITRRGIMHYEELSDEYMMGKDINVIFDLTPNEIDGKIMNNLTNENKERNHENDIDENEIINDNDENECDQYDNVEEYCHQTNDIVSNEDYSSISTAKRYIRKNYNNVDDDDDDGDVDGDDVNQKRNEDVNINFDNHKNHSNQNRNGEMVDWSTCNKFNFNIHLSQHQVNNDENDKIALTSSIFKENKLSDDKRKLREDDWKEITSRQNSRMIKDVAIAEDTCQTINTITITSHNEIVADEVEMLTPTQIFSLSDDTNLIEIFPLYH